MNKQNMRNPALSRHARCSAATAKRRRRAAAWAPERRHRRRRRLRVGGGRAVAPRPPSRRHRRCTRRPFVGHVPFLSLAGDCVLIGSSSNSLVVGHVPVVAAVVRSVPVPCATVLCVARAARAVARRAARAPPVARVTRIVYLGAARLAENSTIVISVPFARHTRQRARTHTHTQSARSHRPRIVRVRFRVDTDPARRHMKPRVASPCCAGRRGGPPRRGEGQRRDVPGASSRLKGRTSCPPPCRSRGRGASPT